MGSVALARDKFERIKRQKLRKGYTQAELVDDSQLTIIIPEELEAIATIGQSPKTN